MVISYFYLTKKPVQTAPDRPPDVSSQAGPVDMANAPKATSAKGKTSTMDVPAVNMDSGTAGFLPTKMEDPKLFEFAQKNLKEMSVCLNMKMSAFAENEQMSLQVLENIISPDLGDIVATMEDWSATDIKTGAGEVRRIFIETKESANGEPLRKLKYYSMSSGGQKEIPLSKEQSSNPSDTVIGGLEADGQMIGKSVARKVYFQNGDDLSVVERDGRVYAFELAHDQKTFKCTGFDASASMSCSCK